MFRKILFWFHLCSAILAGVVILIMSVTGVLLAYQRQITNHFDRSSLAPVTASAGSVPMAVEDILARLSYSTAQNPSAITFQSAPAQPYSIDLGRERTIFVDPYSGAILGEGSQRTRRFFRAVTDWHRRLAFNAESRATGQAITGAGNLIFLGIVSSGMYLWLPKKWTWSNVRAIMLFRGGLRGKVRDFNWHNVFGFWCCIPLFVIVLTAVVMSYSWANNALYLITRTEPPVPERARETAAAGRPDRPSDRGTREGGARSEAQASFSGLNAALEAAKAKEPAWQQITMRLGNENPKNVAFSILTGPEGMPNRRAQMVVARDSGEVLRWEPFATNSAGRRLRIWFRFLHTGEAGGIIGQTIAALATGGAVFLFYTGFALAIRRLLRWMDRRRSQAIAGVEGARVVVGLPLEQWSQRVHVSGEVPNNIEKWRK
jgi:uncharacterized iron-regulated membrane protein